MKVKAMNTDLHDETQKEAKWKAAAQALVDRKIYICKYLDRIYTGNGDCKGNFSTVIYQHSKRQIDYPSLLRLQTLVLKYLMQLFENFFATPTFLRIRTKDLFVNASVGQSEAKTGKKQLI